MTLDKTRIAELVRLIIARNELVGGTAKGRVIDERAEQVVVTRTGFVRSRNNRIDNAKMRARTDALHGDPCTGTNRSADQRAVFECAHDGCADRNNASTVVFRTVDGSRAVTAGIRYGSSNGNRRSSASSPVDEIPAACVMVTKSAPRVRIDANVFQSTMNPADGGSKANGAPATGVQTSHKTSGV